MLVANDLFGFLGNRKQQDSKIGDKQVWGGGSGQTSVNGLTVKIFVISI
jgi:hypothetical protein